MNGEENTIAPVGRFAPSPTGPLHFGSMVTAVGSYCLAKQKGGAWLVRMEDLDLPRVVPGVADEILRTLEALGMGWDGEVVYQSRRAPRYQEALDALKGEGLVFGCGCTRKEILASAPHPGEEGPVYPGTCRQGIAEGRKPRSLRVKVPEKLLCFSDGIFGRIEQRLSSAVGDFVLRRADGLFAYQLAVVVDDADAGVNQVVRGADLLSSTPRQIYLHACLGTASPHYIHLPLALAEGGQKISKRHGAVPCDPADGGVVLFQCLRFLGQEAPSDLRRASPKEVLAWGVANFDLGKVPTRSRILDPDL